MKDSAKILCGAALVCLGIVVILNLLGILDFNLLFDGWWSLFIIVPSTIGLLSGHDKTGSIFGIGLGVILLLAAQSIIEWADIWKFFIALFAIVWGTAMLFGKGKYWGCNKANFDELKTIDRSGRKISELNNSFGHRIVSYAGQSFEGADVKVSFGAAEIDLRGADILDGAIVRVDCAFGGVEIRVDHNVNVKVAANTAFGGVNDERRIVPAEGAKTLYIEGNCSFGGIEIK